MKELLYILIFSLSIPLNCFCQKEGERPPYEETDVVDIAADKKYESELRACTFPGYDKDFWFTSGGVNSMNIKIRLYSFNSDIAKRGCVHLYRKYLYGANTNKEHVLTFEMHSDSNIVRNITIEHHYVYILQAGTDVPIDGITEESTALAPFSSVEPNPNFKVVTLNASVSGSLYVETTYEPDIKKDNLDFNRIVTVIPQSTMGFIDFIDNEGASYAGEPTGPGIPLDYSDTTYIQPLISIQYFDGLSRPVQTTQKAITPNKSNLYIVQEYDGWGRPAKLWLPGDEQRTDQQAPSSFSFDETSSSPGEPTNPTEPGEPHNNIMVSDVYKNVLGITERAKILNNDLSPFSYPIYDGSPLDRVIGNYKPGHQWHSIGKSQNTAYKTNVANGNQLNCINFKAGSAGNDTILSLTNKGNYPTGALYVFKYTDENGADTYEFKDKTGQTILIRQVNEGNNHDTYYVYDDFGNLCIVLPPIVSDELKSMTTWHTNQSKPLQQYAFMYKYDKRKRCIAKKIPGCGWILYKYDKADRLIFSQDAEQRVKNEWLFSIPDALGRVVLSGTCKTLVDIDATVVKAKLNLQNQTDNYYDININITEKNIMSTSYYDNYLIKDKNEFINLKYNNNGKEPHPDDHPYTTNKRNKGMLTATIIGILDGNTNRIFSVFYYDSRKRLVQTQATNHLGGYEREYIAYNFMGQPTQKKHVHSATGKNTQTEVYTYSYDHAGRLLTTKHQLTDGTAVKPQVTLAENTYDDLGRLKTNKKNNQVNLNTTYTYNVRSWTSTITNAHFNETLAYTYNGNISKMQWGQASKTRSYNFTYDSLSRVRAAAYTGESPTNFATSYTYDKHGNIKTLQRYGLTTATTYGIIDNLTAEHTGNQLKYITDAGPNVTLNASMDFKDYTKGTGVEYTYNANGAMVKDLNKGISAIAYNLLNLPRIVDIKNRNAEGRNEYTYSASGQKLKAIQKWNPNYSTTPLIGSAVNVSSLTMSSTTDYAGNIIYENNALKRILVDGGYYEAGNYYFYITDHLGNNRIVANAAASVVQSTQYYPFGMPFADASGQNIQPYKYNNKELDARNGLNWYDYNARYLSLDYPILPTVDPMAEKYYSISPYVYCNNNPLRFIDPTGMFYDDYFSEEGKYLGTDNSSTDNVRVVNEGQYNLNKESDGTIDPEIGTSISQLHSKSEITTEASLNIYEHYNPTGLTLTNARPGQFSTGGGMEVQSKKGILSNIDVDVAGFNQSEVADHSNEIKNIFVHENKHVSDVNEMGVKAFMTAGKTYTEGRAIKAQMTHPTFKTMRTGMQNSVINYGVKFGASFDIKQSSGLIKNAPTAIKPIIKLK